MIEEIPYFTYEVWASCIQRLLGVYGVEIVNTSEDMNTGEDIVEYKCPYCEGIHTSKVTRG
jgi:hypothetical protein